jgi:mono/diheme cytochrome c family protein
MNRRTDVLTCLAILGGCWMSAASAQTPATSVAAPAAANTPERVVQYWLEPAPDAGTGIVERGKWLFRHQGCFLCHGPEGQGGIANRNYLNDTIPRLALAQWMKLLDQEDVAAILEPLKRGIRLESLESAPPVPQFNVVLAQYHSVLDLIRNGSVAGKKDPKGPKPPLNMPHWGRQLTDGDIDAIIAYLLAVQPVGTDK